MSGSRTKALRRELESIPGRKPTSIEFRVFKDVYKQWRRGA